MDLEKSSKMAKFAEIRNICSKTFEFFKIMRQLDIGAYYNIFLLKAFYVKLQ